MLRLLLVFCFCLLPCAAATDYPYTVTDELGREVTLTQEPQRIVSMVPSHSETLCALHACDKLIAVDDYSTFPKRLTALPQLGGGLTGTSIEELVALKPDLVLVSEYGELATTLAQVGLTVYAGTPQTFADTFTLFGILGALVNREVEAAALSQRVKREIRRISEQVAGLSEPSVYFEVDTTPYSVGPNSFIGQQISAAGGKNIVIAELGDFPRLEPEYIVAADPDFIFVAAAAAARLKARPGWSTITAVADNQVIALSAAQNNILSRPGPRLAQGVRFFARILHPQAFGK